MLQTRAEKDTRQSSADTRQQTGAEAVALPDHRPEATVQRKLQQAADSNGQDNPLAQLNALAGKHAGSGPPPVQKKANDTGLPDNLKSGIEALSGYAMDDVKVHYNSAKPAQLQAHAYAQGTDIHLAPGQEQHLPHEAWHVVQQKQGRVKATRQLKGIAVNDDSALEKEADAMGEKIAQMHTQTDPGQALRTTNGQTGVVQRKIGMEFESANGESWKVWGQKAPSTDWNLVTDTKQPIYEEAGSFEVQGDRGHLEFVTKPHDSWANLSGAVQGIVKLIGEWNGKSFDAKAGTGNWKGPVNYTDYQLSCKGNLILKPQANIGIPLSKIQHFFDAAQKDKSVVTRSLKDAIGFVNANTPDKLVGYAEEQRKKLMGGGYKPLDKEPYERLVGFVSEILAVIQQAYSNSSSGLEDPKYAFEMMPRTDFKSMAQGLGKEGFEALEIWIAKGYLQDALEKSSIPMRDGLFTGKYRDAKKKVEKGPTREEWLDSILTGSPDNPAKDLMSPPKGYPAHNDPTHQPPEGIGTMGMDGDLAVFELRNILDGVSKTVSPDNLLELTAMVANIVATANGDKNLVPK